MMPNIDPRTLKNMMAKMGIKSSEIEASEVIIKCPDKDIIVSEPQILQIDAQGSISFQISGSISENQKEVKIDVSEDDIKMVMEKSGIRDYAKAKEALESANGDIAEAIMKLSGQSA
ncbi:MAG: nascent polypeptide-associated complex protein [Candidatus Marsarchaeota archaeon]|nr:nascent polypeptide-associated complex protein [Candidatus Marsarchaeota archaeon]